MRRTYRKRAKPRLTLKVVARIDFSFSSPRFSSGTSAPVHTVRSTFGNRFLMGALGVSLGAHASVMAIRFIDPEFLRIRSSDTALEVILVNARSESRPSNAEALAQSNLDGGGANDSGRRTSPLPSSFEMRDGDVLEAARNTVARLEQEQKELLAKLARGEIEQRLPQKETKSAQPDAGSEEQMRQQLARVQAEIAKTISDYQKRPRKHHFMPSTSAYPYARYVEDWRARVEKIGNEHYPIEARGKYYGELRMTVSIRKDGSLIDAVVDKSSGSAVLDRAARRIVILAAPYPPFPPDVTRDTDVLEITRTWIFTNDQFATRSSGRDAAVKP